MSNPPVEIEGLTKVFPVPLRRERVVAVRDLSLRVEKGEVYGLLGPNGSGKSTTLKILLGLVTATRGTTRVFGEESRSVRSRKDVGFLPENPYFYKFLTGAETVRFFGKLSGMSGDALEARVAELLELVGLADAAARRVGSYSKGMLQRVGLAQALVQDPGLLVLDEPTAGVDPVGSREIRDLILKLKSRGKTVLLCSHLLSQVQEVCDRVGILARGSLVREGRVEDLLALEDRHEMVLENATPEQIAELGKAAERLGVRVVSSGRAQTTLENLFLDAIQPGQSPDAGSGRNLNLG
ncbi:MAG: ABC transporter ATP-binding protein [Chthoniobacterales bacterium]|nr:ABC transporter ATP-binding protein [Chthoniobacterales bacterium]